MAMLKLLALAAFLGVEFGAEILAGFADGGLPVRRELSLLISCGVLHSRVSLELPANGVVRCGERTVK